ncbi:MAG: alpha/beta fold hydrolase [Planctomycetota bacterium]|nr:alpha/beta fold hydrolase [Planctomycetota bacterium]
MNPTCARLTHQATLRTQRRFTIAALMALACSPQGFAEQPAVPKYSEHQDLGYYLDSKGKRQSIEAVQEWQIRKAHVIAHLESVMGPLPRPKSPVKLGTKTLEETQLPNGLVRRKLQYHTDSESRTLNAYLFIPPDVLSTSSKPKRPAVLCLHQTTRIGKQEPAGMGGNPNLHYALHLARRGFVTLAPDYPSFGDYTYDFAPDKGYVSGTMKAVYDNVRAIDLLQSLPYVDGERIGCIGHSLGGHNTMFTAAFEPRIKVLVSNCGFTRFHKYYNGRIAGWTSTRYMPRIADIYQNNADLVPFDFTEIVASFAPRPFLASAPIRDSNFEVSGVRDVIQSAAPIYALYGKRDHLLANYPNSAHDFPEDARRVAYDFLDKHLRAAVDDR